MDANAVRRIVNEEVSKRMIELKKALDAELKSDFIAFRGSIMAEIEKSKRTEIDTLQTKINEMNGQLIVTSEKNALAIRENMQALVQTVVRKAKDDIMNDIDTTIIPRINNAIDLINYNSPDVESIITEERLLDPRIGPQPKNKSDDRFMRTNVMKMFGEND
jgi:hypothetical protein